MSSKKVNQGPYNIDKVIYNHKGKVTTSILNSPVFEKMIEDLDVSYKYDVGYIPFGLKNSPDLIANEYYGSPGNWWFIMFVNNINDPFESLQPNQKLLLPKIK